MSPEQQSRAVRLANYVGSPEHKLPGARSDATLCPPDLKSRQSDLTRWLQEALAEGNAGGPIEGGFPRYVWYRDGGRYFEGRLTNQELGEYKGYPVDPEEFPRELRADA